MPPDAGASRVSSSAAFGHPAEFYDYLVEARGRLFGPIRAIPPRQYTRRFGFGWGSIRATFVHMADIEWWYTSMLDGPMPPPAQQFPFRRFARRTFGPLENAWTELAERTRRVLRAQTAWERPIRDDWTTKRWERGIRTTAREVAIQLLFHDVHHRAQVMAMLRLLGRPVQGLDYSLMRWQWIKEPRVGRGG